MTSFNANSFKDFLLNQFQLGRYVHHNPVQPQAGVNAIKLFSLFLKKISSEQECLQPSLIFGSLPAYLSEAPFRNSTLGYAPYLTHKHYTRLERLARDKRSSLLRKLITCGRKKFYNIDTRSGQPGTS